ncbi:MAG: hypothetical protein IKQ03_01585 [Prevotella sp.]|nr:hypothetical protein [Prevotella sp.]
MRKNQQTPIPDDFPSDINAEVFLGCFPRGTCRVAFQGLHKRNSYNDIVELEPIDEDHFKMYIGRQSLYNSLPEYMFHPIDRFDNLPQYEEKERFEEELYAQQEEVENAFRFFAPIDILLLQQRMHAREELEPFARENIVMQQIIGDDLTKAQRRNRFIKRFVKFMPQFKYIRGNKTLLTLLLRKVFFDEGLRVRVTHEMLHLHDDVPRYADRLDMDLGDGYVGNEWDELITVYQLHYWSEDECGGKFLDFLDEVEELRIFIQDYLLAVGEELRFDITQDEKPLRLGDELFYNYLGYNTNI